MAVLLLNFDLTYVRYVGGSKCATSASFPTIKDNYAGNQVVGIEGDMRVRIKKRTLA